MNGYGCLTAGGGHLTAAVSYLLLCNATFILPLVGIIMLGCLGVHCESLGNFLVRHVAGFKFAMVLVFAGLGAIIIMII